MSCLYDHGDGQAGLTHPRQHPKPVEIRHHQVENDPINARSLGSDECLDGGIPTLGNHDLVAKTLDHGFEQAPLNGIVIDDKHDFGHWTPHAQTVPNWCNVAALP